MDERERRRERVESRRSLVPPHYDSLAETHHELDTITVKTNHNALIIQSSSHPACINPTPCYDLRRFLFLSLSLSPSLSTHAIHILYTHTTVIVYISSSSQSHSNKAPNRPRSMHVFQFCHAYGHILSLSSQSGRVSLLYFFIVQCFLFRLLSSVVRHARAFRFTSFIPCSLIKHKVT